MSYHKEDFLLLVKLIFKKIYMMLIPVEVAICLFFFIYEQIFTYLLDLLLVKSVKPRLLIFRIGLYDCYSHCKHHLIVHDDDYCYYLYRIYSSLER